MLWLSPRMRGCFSKRPWRDHIRRSFPRVCGDVSNSPQEFLNALKLSPRMRGCFYILFALVGFELAFPAYAGMFLPEGSIILSDKGFPRVCGDVSKEIYAQGTVKELSPRMRGCFRHFFAGTFSSSAFPAYAGMFLSPDARLQRPECFPRVCGDVSWFR